MEIPRICKIPTIITKPINNFMTCDANILKFVYAVAIKKN